MDVLRYFPATCPSALTLDFAVPFMFEHRELNKRDPLTLQPLALDKPCFLSHAEFLDHGHGSGVAFVDASSHPVGVEAIERNPQQRGGGLGRITMRAILGLMT
jgi:hypothetical protein